MMTNIFKLIYEDPVTCKKFELDVYHIYPLIDDSGNVDSYVVGWDAKNSMWRTVPIWSCQPVSTTKELLNE